MHSKQIPPRLLLILIEVEKETEIPLFDPGYHLGGRVPSTPPWPGTTPSRSTVPSTTGGVGSPGRPATTTATELEGVTVAGPTTDKLVEVA